MKYKHQVAVIKLAETLGRYRSFSQSEQQCIEVESVSYTGDSPSKLYGRLEVGNSPSDPKEILQLAQLLSVEKNHKRLEFSVSRPETETVKNLIYTPLGTGWIDGAMYQKYSLLNPFIFKPETMGSMIQFFTQPRPLEEVPQGTVVEADVINTFGDWVIDYLARLPAAPIVSPLILPKYVAEKPYVKEDLKKLKVDLRVIDEPLRLRNALVIRKTKPGLYWTDREVSAYRAAFGVKLSRPRSGSVVYLSRFGVSSEAGKKAGEREYPSKIVASVVKEFGGRVVVTNSMNDDDYRKIASEVETVIADHGGAMCRLLLWQTQNVIELYSNNWWSDCYLFLGKASGVKNHTLVNIDEFKVEDFRSTLVSILERVQKDQRRTQ